MSTTAMLALVGLVFWLLQIDASTITCPTQVNATSTRVWLEPALLFHTELASNTNGTLALNVVGEPLETAGKIFFATAITFTTGSNGSRYMSTTLNVGNTNHTLQAANFVLDPGHNMLYVDLRFGAEIIFCAVHIVVPYTPTPAVTPEPVPTLGEELWKIITGFGWWVYLLVLGSIAASVTMTVYYCRRLQQVKAQNQELFETKGTQKPNATKPLKPTASRSRV